MPARSAAHSPGPFAERAALAGGLLAAALLGTAWWLMGDAPERLGRSALADFSQRMEERALALWAQRLERPAVAGDGVLRHERTPLALPAPLEASEARDPNTLGFDVLLRQARQSVDAEEARATLDEAAGLDVDPVRVARLALARIQAARRAGDADDARAHWKEWSRIATGREIDEAGLPILVLAGLAVGPLLPPEESAEVQRLLVERWLAGELALPRPVATVEVDSGSGGLRVVTNAAVDFLVDSLNALADPDDRLRLDVAARRALATAAHFGLNDPAPRAAVVIAEHEGHLLARWPVENGWWARVAERDDWLAAFEREWAADEMDRRGVELVLLGAESVAGDSSNDSATERENATGNEEAPSIASAAANARGDWLRPPVTLPAWPGANLRIALAHPDVTGFVRAETSGLRLSRAAFAVLAFVSLAGGIATFGTLRRRRQLQTMKETFIAKVSHELRTPVAGLRLVTESLVEGRAQSEERRTRYYGILQREVRRLDRLVADVLDFSRVERGQGARLERRPTDLTRFARELADAASAEAASTETRLEVELGPFPDQLVELDAEALSRAALNLVRNACLHSGSDLVRLEVRADRGLCIRVLDRGRGIARGDERRIFEPFRQLDAASSKGTGLGLPIAREIVEAHAGRLTLGAGLEGRGAGFAIEVPVE